MNKPTLKIYVFYCSNSLSREELSLCCANGQSDNFKSVSLPCSGKIDIPYLIKAFETGADGVIVITCPEGECHNLEGNMRVRKRSQAVDSLLEETGLGKGRIAVFPLKKGGTGQIKQEITAFCIRIRNMPAPNAAISTSQNNNVVSNQSKSNSGMNREKAT